MQGGGGGLKQHNVFRMIWEINKEEKFVEVIGTSRTWINELTHQGPVSRKSGKPLVLESRSFNMLSR